MSRDKELIAIYVVASMDGNFLKGLLEDAGIPASLWNETI